MYPVGAFYEGHQTSETKQPRAVKDDNPDCPVMNDGKCHLNKCGMFVPTGKNEGACFAHILGVYFANKLREEINEG